MTLIGSGVHIFFVNMKKTLWSDPVWVNERGLEKVLLLLLLL